MAEEVVLMKGNEAIAHAAIRFGVDGYFGYPITPQSEVLETLAEQKPWETTGMVVLQAESEVSAINMVYGGAATGKMVMTSSSSPGVSLKQEGISYIVGADLPALIVNVQRVGPSTGQPTSPSQGDLMQARWGTHGDHWLIALTPASVPECFDLTLRAYALSEKYRVPVILLMDEVIGHMREKIELPDNYDEIPQAERKQPTCAPEEFKAYVEQGVIQGGMIPKLENSFSAIDAGVSQVVITQASAINGEGGTIIRK